MEAARERSRSGGGAGDDADLPERLAARPSVSRLRMTHRDSRGLRRQGWRAVDRW